MYIKPTNMELDKWAAEQVMNWEYFQEDMYNTWYIWGDKEEAKRLLLEDGPVPPNCISVSKWHPSFTHDQCQEVLDKIQDWGVRLNMVCKLLHILTPNRNPCGDINQLELYKCITATPRQKLLALYRALDE